MGDKKNNARITDAKSKRQQHEKNSKLYRGILIVCNLLSRQVEPGTLPMH